MSERPIIFQGWGVRAIFANIKTKTRRVPTWFNSYVDGQRTKFWREHWSELDFAHAWADDGPSPAGNPGPYLHVPFPPEGTTHRVYPCWRPGDTLWVRETWRFLGVDMNRHGRTHWVEDAVIEYKDGTRRTIEVDWRIGEKELTRNNRWHPSIHMPRWACRLTLRLSEVRLQRVQDISEEDARAEGIQVEWRDVDGRNIYGSCEHLGFGHEDQALTARDAFGKLWDTINFRRGYGWTSNPWVYALTFIPAPSASREAGAQEPGVKA